MTGLTLLSILLPALAQAPASTSPGPACSVQTGTLLEADPSTSEVSTDEMRRIVADQSAIVLDARPHAEFAISHIPGAVNVSQKPGTTMALYVSDVKEVERIAAGRKGAPLVLYCNGPYCGKSKRLAADLAGAGFTNVRRYQLGIPVWRALGGVTQIEPGSIRYVFQNDKTAVWLDTRPRAEFQRGTIAGAKPLPPDAAQTTKDNSAMMKAKNDGTLPMNDHNARIVVFGTTPGQARAVAEALTREAFANVAFFGGSYTELANLTKGIASK